MENPFLINGAQTLLSSLNRIPLAGGSFVSDSLRGKTFNQLVTAQKSPEQLGRAIGIMLLSLSRGDGETQQAFPIWENKHWQWWKSIERVYLGGGRVCDADSIRSGLDLLFDEFGRPGFEVIIAENPALLPVIGAARYAAEVSGRFERVISLDFGHTNVKRGILTAEGFKSFGSIPAVHTDMSDTAFTADEGMLLHNFMKGVILKTFAETGGCVSPFVGISIANYIQNDGTIVRRGGYGKLLLLAENYARFLENDLGGLRPCLLHDGAAAAYSVGEQNKRCAVITLGTSIGVGFI